MIEETKSHINVLFVYSFRLGSLNFFTVLTEFTLINIKFKLHLAFCLTDVKETLRLLRQKGIGRRGDLVDNCLWGESEE